MESTTINNSWVDSYLESLLTAGLSSEHARRLAYSLNASSPNIIGGTGNGAGPDHGHVTAKYYVNQVLQLDEERIRDAWHKAARPARIQGERDARIAYLAWRVWGMKRHKAAVAADTTQIMAKDNATVLEMEDGAETSLLTIEDLSTAALDGPDAYAVHTLAADDVGDHQVPEADGMQQVSWDGLYGMSAPAGALPSAMAMTPVPGASFSPRQSIPTPASPFGSCPAAEAGPDPLLVSRFPRMYIVLISLHGLVRGTEMELGRDPDTGGQVKYVVELTRAMGRIPSVARVDLLTRLITDPTVDASYGRPEEPLAGQIEGRPVGPFIVRLAAGPSEVYLRKEDLWPHVREFADRAIGHISSTLAHLREWAGEPVELYMVHGHYADAGEAAALISSTLAVDMALTGHSLGCNKKEHLLKSGAATLAEIEATYRISRRIEGEERALDAALVVFTSTQQEVVEQWGLYDGYSEQLSSALCLRPRSGYHMPHLTVIPPGLDFSNLKVQLPQDPWLALLGPAAPAGVHITGATSPPVAQLAAAPAGPQETGQLPAASPFSPKAVQAMSSLDGHHQDNSDSSSSNTSTGSPVSDSSSCCTPVSSSSNRSCVSPNSPSTPALFSHPVKLASAMLGGVAPEPSIWREINRFLCHPGKPVILAMSRPDAKKNILSLVRAYGSSPVLKELANLVLIMGNRDVIDGMVPGSARVLSDVLKLIDAYDLYGRVAYPKKHCQADISDIYLLVAATKGVFVNVALQEPFGLTLIEAAAHGVPIVATTNGGPVDIVATLHNGALVEPTDVEAIARACQRIITHTDVWEQMSCSGRQNIVAYSWPSHCARALRAVEDHKRALESSRIRPCGGGNRTRRHSLAFDDLQHLFRSVHHNNQPPSSPFAAATTTEPQESSAASAILPQATTTTTTTINSKPAAPAVIHNGRATDPSALVSPALLSDALARDGGGRTLLALRTGSMPPGVLDNLSGLMPRVPLLGQQIQEEDGQHHNGSGRDGCSGGNDQAACQLSSNTPRLLSHERFVVVVVDRKEDVSQALAIIRSFQQASLQPDGSLTSHDIKIAGSAAGLASDLLAGHDAADYGAAIMCNWSCKEMVQLMREQGLDTCDLDFMVCNAGSLIWHNTSDSHCRDHRQADGCSEGINMLCDDGYERHVEWRWDAVVVQRVLQHVIDSKLGWGRLPVRPASALGSTSSSSSSHNSIALGISSCSTPLHFMLEVVVGSAVAARTNISGLAQQLLAVVRRKLRKSGVRAQLLITADTTSNALAVDSPPPASATSCLLLHITPLRASRALALRYLAHHSHKDLSHFTLVGFTSSPPPRPLVSEGKAAQGCVLRGADGLGPARSGSLGMGLPQQDTVSLGASDADELVGGLPQVVLVPSRQGVTSKAADVGDDSSGGGGGVMSCAFPVDPAVLGVGRVRVMMT